LPTFNIYKNLAWLNGLTGADAENVFLDCCGSREWARRMATARPFPMLRDLFQRAYDVWFSLPIADHLEAFAAHPKIGSKNAGVHQTKNSARLSKGEQSSVDAATADVRNELAKANRLYEKKFGFIFIVCATGKTADEMLTIARARIGNSVQTELQLAAVEQAKITEIRLNKLLEK